jgi:methyl-accepting chemotaxis protein
MLQSSHLALVEEGKNIMQIKNKLVLINIAALLGMLLVIATSMIGYESLMTSMSEHAAHEMKDIDTARSVQVAFKKQVQEWKNILLRGEKPEKYKKYLDKFTEQESLIDKKIAEMSSSEDTPQIKAMIDDFSQAHKKLAGQYRQGLVAFNEAGSEKYKAGDKAVDGIDRGPTDKLDALVEAYEKEYTDLVVSEQESKNHLRILISTLTLLIIGVLSTGIYIIGKSIFRSVQLAEIGCDTILRTKEISRPIAIHNKDEIGNVITHVNNLIAAMGKAIVSAKKIAEDNALIANELT